MAVLTREIEIVSPRPGRHVLFCFWSNYICPQGTGKSSEEAVSVSWVNSRCLDPFMKDFLLCFPKTPKKVQR